MIAEELASHGFIVALVESPFAGFIMTAAGQLVIDTSGRYETPAAHRAGVAVWSRDVSFALDQLQEAPLPRDVERVARAIDWTRVGAAGHSSGGLVAIATCESDPRVRSCANLDGGVAAPTKEPMADFVPLGTTKPTLFLRSKPLYSDADFARRGITRGEWVKRGEGGKVALDSFVTRARGPLWMGSIAGTGHMSFSDAPFVMPSTITRFGGKIIDPVRGLEAISATLRAFFELTFDMKTSALHEVTAKYPEVLVDRVDASRR